MSNYRVLVTYDPERSVYVARAPELEHCSAEGATRAEAVARVDEEIDAQLRNIREHGGRIPPVIDEDGAGFSGEIAAKVSRTLHRDLVWQARAEGVDLPQLVGEMLAVALESRRQRGRRPAAGPQSGEPRPERQADGDARQGGQRPFRQGERGQGGRYHAIMEDRATFLEYVRGLDSSGAPRGPGGGGRRRGRGRFGAGPESPDAPDANKNDPDEGGDEGGKR
jgi:predicted RNase H-like HicB family nuclease